MFYLKHFLMLLYNYVFSMYFCTFGREITVEAMSIRSAECSVALDILQKIAYSSSAEAYKANRKLLNETGFTKVSEYFETNWHPIRQEWVACFANDFNFNT